MVDLEKVKQSRTIKELGLHVCQYCGKEVDGRRIFCPEHATVLNKQIYEFFVDLPVRPRGAKMFDIIETYFKAQLGLTKQKRIILKSITGAGKCLEKSTLVETSEGMKQIKDISIGDKVFGFDIGAQSIIENDVLQTYKFEKERTKKIRTRCGYTIEGTPSHKIVVIASDGYLKYKTLDEISHLDYVVFSRKSYDGPYQDLNYRYPKNVKATNSHPLSVNRVNEKIAEFLGYYIAEGYATKERSVVLTNGLNRIASSIKKIVEDEFHLHCGCKWYENNHAYTLSIGSIALDDFLDCIGCGRTSKKKRIPKVIFASPMSVKTAFLHAFFDGDGYYESKAIGCVSVSKLLIEDIQQILLSMGIISTQHYKAVKYKGRILDSWRLSIVSESFSKFFDLVGDFYSTSKTTKECFLNKKRNTNIVTIPNISNQLAILWKDFVKKTNLSGRRYLTVPSGTKGSYELCESRGLHHNSIWAYRANVLKPSFPQLKRILDVLRESSDLSEYAYLQQLLNSELFFDRIEKIEKGECDVYDITTSQTHNYIANGMVSHNSYMMDMMAFIELTHFPNSLTVIGSVSDSVSKEHVMRLRTWISNSLFSKYISGSRDATASKTEIHLATLNSRVISIPQAEKTRTGWHGSLLLIDEVGRMRRDAYYSSFYQMARLGATEILASTPFADSALMQDIWNSDGIKQVALTPNDCWWVDKSIFRQAKKDLPPNLYSQLYEAQFRTLSNRVIPDDIFLEALVRGQHLPQSQNLLMGIDFGQKIDPTAIVIIDLETGDVKFTMQFSDAWKIQFAKIRQIYNEWRPIKIMADKSSIGSVIIDELSDLPIEGVSMHNDILKKRVVDRLIMAFINHKVNIVADEFSILVSQLSSFVYLDQDHKKMGPSGRGHDDFVDALGLALMGFDVSSVTENAVGDNVWMFTRVPGSSSSPWKIGGF